jgi:hypothetical protein
MSKPFVVLETSSCALALGVVVPIPTLCDLTAMIKNEQHKISKSFFILSYIFIQLKIVKMKAAAQ